MIQTKHGDCDACPESTDTTLFQMPHGLWLCKDCKDRELLALSEQSKAMNKVISDARQIDESVVLKPHVFNAKTVSLIIIKAAIDNNPDIPENEKDHAFVREVDARVKALKAAIFKKRQELIEDDNELRMLQKNGQEAAAKLRADIRAQYISFDVTYAPTHVVTAFKDSTKAVKKAQSKAVPMKEVNEAAAKYGVPAYNIKSMTLTRKISADAAGAELSKLLKKAN